MFGQLERWSAANLGQWHYVFGYAIVLLSHNWPIILALVGAFWFGAQAYRRPTRHNVSWLLTALLLGLAYEYDKHVAAELHKAVDFLFGIEIAAWNRPMHILVGPVAKAALLASFLVMLAQSIMLTLAVRSRLKTRARGPQPYNRDNTAPPAHE